MVPGINDNQNLSPTLAAASVGLAALVAGFYKFWIEKSVEERVKIMIVSHWRSKSEDVESSLRLLHEESRKESPDFARLADYSDKLAAEFRYLQSVTGRYDLFDYTTYSIILFLASFLLSLTDMANRKPIWYVMMPPHPVYLNGIAAVALICGLWYLFKIIIIWQEIMHTKT